MSKEIKTLISRHKDDAILNDRIEPYRSTYTYGDNAFLYNYSLVTGAIAHARVTQPADQITKPSQDNQTSPVSHPYSKSRQSLVAESVIKRYTTPGEEGNTHVPDAEVLHVGQVDGQLGDHGVVAPVVTHVHHCQRPEGQATQHPTPGHGHLRSTSGQVMERSNRSVIMVVMVLVKVVVVVEVLGKIFVVYG